MKTIFWVIGAVVVAIGTHQAIQASKPSEWLLKGFNEQSALNTLKLQLAVSAFCLDTTAMDALEREGMDTDATEIGRERTFETDGNISNDEYTKQSIYNILYSLYSMMGRITSEQGVEYQFTHNTWGISKVDATAEAFQGSPAPYDSTEPQRHGKNAYAALVNFPAVKEVLAASENPRILEVGCGTGAGASLVANLFPQASFTALDMQQAAIDMCNTLHASVTPNLECVHGNGVKLPMADGSVDIVIISETHIADIEIGPEEKRIFAELQRVLKPGGLFLWGNALPTRVWNVALPYLSEIGFNDCGSYNHTHGAVVARDEDAPRVEKFCDDLFDSFPVFKVATRCRGVIDLLIKNFFRHPPTRLYNNMVSGSDSYLHVCYQMPTKASKEE